MSDFTATDALDLRPGELVEVRSAAEIYATLDERGELDSLPFMPEMLPYCGQQFQVYRRADKTCDTIARYVARRMHRTVHLTGLRCDGRAHGGCQAACLLFWKEAWLRRIPKTATGTPIVQVQRPTRSVTSDAESQAQLQERLRKAANWTDEQGVRYACQATELLRASEPLAWWDPRQYLRDIRTRNVTLIQLARGTWYASYAMVRRALSRSKRYPYFGGILTKTPTEQLDLQAGELVQVRSRKEIYATLDERAKNRGLSYDVEMWKYSGGTYRVLHRVERIVNEKNGRMITLPNGCVVLDGVVCSGERSKKRMFCPRSVFPYWREIWLRRVPETVAGDPAGAVGKGPTAVVARPVGGTVQ